MTIDFITWIRRAGEWPDYIILHCLVLMDEVPQTIIPKGNIMFNPHINVLPRELWFRSLFEA